MEAMEAMEPMEAVEAMEPMLFSESVLVALTLMLIVFATLLGLYVCVKLFSFFVQQLEKTGRAAAPKPTR